MIEIDAGCHRDANFRQHARAERGAVVGALGDVGEQIERALV